MLDDGMVATDEKIWRTNLSGKHRRGGAATCSVPPKSVDPFSQTFTYDPLNRLVANTLGGVTNQSRTLDTDYVLLRQEPKSRLSEGAAYRETSYTSYGTTQTQTANAQNQITSISGSTAPTYDANGNMASGSLTSQPAASVTMVYNAWNQLVSVSNAAGQVIAQYTYNAMGYRITETYPQGGNGIAAGTVNNIYYDSSWQAIETRTDGTASSNVTSQTVWSAAYINAVVLQDTYSAGVIQPNSRLYFLQDANWNTTAIVGLVSGSWQVTQRFAYSPYGTITVLTSDWSTTGETPLASNLYQGMTLDPVTGLYYARNRNYSPSLGRWINQDPAGYINGANTYQFVMSNPLSYVDPIGLAGLSFSYISPGAWANVADAIEEKIQADSMGGSNDGWTHNGAAKFVPLVLRLQGATHDVEVQAAEDAAKVALKLGTLLNAEDPIGWLGGALGFSGKNGIKLAVKLLENELQILKTRRANEIYRAFWQKKLPNGWNVGSIYINYNPFTGVFKGDLVGSVGELNDEGTPNGQGSIHPFYYPFSGALTLNNDHDAISFKY